MSKAAAGGGGGKCLTVDQVFPVGMVTSFLGFVAPNGWLLCDGSWVSESEYSALYSVIGDVYDYASEKAENIGLFKLPDLRGRFLEGKTNSGSVGDKIEAGLPDHDHTYSYATIDDKHFTNTGGLNPFHTRETRNTGLASVSNSIYGNSTTVQPPAVLVNFIIYASAIPS